MSNSMTDALYLDWYKNDLGQKESRQTVNESQTIANSQILLNGIPDKMYKVQVANIDEIAMFEIDIMDNISEPKYYKVDYTFGNVYFHSSLEGKSISLNYYSRGMVKINAKRVYGNSNGVGINEKSLQDYIDGMSLVVTATDKANEISVWGDFDIEYPYKPLNKVSYNGSSYINKIACIGVYPTDESHWRLVAKGSNGFSTILESKFIATVNTTNAVHGISGFDVTRDNLQVYDGYSGSLLEKGVHYNLNANNLSIDLISWSLSVGDVINFKLFKNLNDDTIQTVIDNSIVAKSNLDESIVVGNETSDSLQGLINTGDLTTFTRNEDFVGESITVNNDIHPLILAELNSINSQISDVVHQSSLTTTNNNIGTITNLTTQNKANLVSAINEVVTSQAEKVNYTMTENGAVIESQTNENWSGWNEERLNFGLTKANCPVPTINKSPLISQGTMIAGGLNTNMMRWGYHVLEGYASDNKSRITMLVNKHIEESKALAELYYYLTVYNHSNAAYGWFKLGSDVKQHSFMFSRDKAIAFGEWDLRNVMTLARISPSNDIDSTYQTIEEADAVHEGEFDSIANAKCVLYLALKNAKNGAIFYDTDRNKVVVKVNSLWCDMQVTLSDDYYDFGIVINNIGGCGIGADLNYSNVMDISLTKSIYFKVKTNTNYTITKSNPTQRFRVGLFNDEKPAYGTAASIVFNETDTSTLNCTFNSGSYKWCYVTYTVSGQACNFSVTK